MDTRPEVRTRKTSPARIWVVAPTMLEYLAVRRALPRVKIIHSGIALSRLPALDKNAIVVVCGLAGGLLPGVSPGTVAIPQAVGLPNESLLHCDSELVAALAAGAHDLGYEPDMRPLLTAPSLVTGAARVHWMAQGFASVDMETALLAARAHRVATVRVLLDTPDRSIAEQWELPMRAVLQPARWTELIWLAGTAPRYAIRAASVLRAGLDRLRDTLETGE